MRGKESPTTVRRLAEICRYVVMGAALASSGRNSLPRAESVRRRLARLFSAEVPCPPFSLPCSSKNEQVRGPLSSSTRLSSATKRNGLANLWQAFRCLLRPLPARDASGRTTAERIVDRSRPCCDHRHGEPAAGSFCGDDSGNEKGVETESIW